MRIAQRFYYFLFILFIFSAKALAVPGLTTYQARIIKPDGQPLEAINVSFRFTFLNPQGTCILYIEDYTAINMTGTSGLASFSLGSGIKTFPTSASVTFKDVFNNSTPTMDCHAAGTYTPGVSDTRKIVMQFSDTSGWQTLPAMSINAVPYSMYATQANNSILLNNKADTAFVQHSSIPNCGAGQALHYTGGSFTCVSASGGVSGTISAGDITTALGYTPVNPSTLSASFTSVASYSTVTSTVSGLGNSVTAITSAFSSFQATTAASFAAISGSGISTLNGSTSATQAFGTGTSGNSPAFVTAAGVHTLNLPYASVGTTTAGLISNSDYSLFSTVINKITSSAASIVQVLGYTPADQAQVTTLSSTVGAVSSSVNSLSSTVAGKITSSAVSIAQVLGYTPAASGASASSQWANNGAKISYNSGNVGIGTSNPATRLEVSNGSTPLSSSFNAISISAFNPDYAEHVSATIGLGKSTYHDSYGEAMEFKYTSEGALQPQYVFRGTVSASDVVINDGGLKAITVDANFIRFHGPYAQPHIYSLIPKVNFTAFNIWDVNTYGGNPGFGIGVVSATGMIQGYNVNVTSGSFAIRTMNADRLVVTSGGVVGIGTSTPVAKLDVSGGVRISMDYNTCASNLAGTLRYNGGLVEYCNGTSWSAFGVAGAGVTNFNGSTSGSQTFANGVAGTEPAISSVNGVHTLNIPYASVGTTTAGLISNTDYSLFSTVANKITSSAASIAQVLGYTPAASGGVNSQWTTSGTAIHYTNGYVGIGTTSPTRNLNIRQDIDGTMGVFAENLVSGSLARSSLTVLSDTAGADFYSSSSNFAGNFGTYPASDAVVIRTYSSAATRPNNMFVGTGSTASHFHIITGQIPRFTVEGTGNIGIGMTYGVSSTARLHIASGNTSLAPLKLTSGALVSSPADGAIEYDGTSLYYTDSTATRRTLASTVGGGSGLATFNGSTSATQTLAYGNSGTAPSFSTANGVHTLNIPFASAVATTAGLISNTDYVNFNNKVSSQWNTSGTTINYMNGNVGIGTTNPETQLHIKSPGDIRITDDTSSGSWQREAKIFGQGAEFKATGALTPAMGFYRAQGVLASPTAVLNGDIVGRQSYLAFYPNGTGNDWIQGYSQLETYVDEANGWTMGLGLKVPLSLRWSSLNSAGTRKYQFMIGANGNVGVGTSSPATTLTVVGSGSTHPSATTWINTPGMPLLGTFSDSSSTGAQDFLIGGANNTAGVRPVMIGRKSRGTLANPTALATGDTVFSFMASGYDGNSFSNPGSIDFVTSGAISSGTLGMDITFRTGVSTRSERMRLTSSGNLGIGTSSPLTTLDVSGAIRTTAGYFFADGTSQTTAVGSVKATATFNCGQTLAANSCYSEVHSLPGATTNDTLSWNTTNALPNGITMTVWISGASSVTARVCNSTAGGIAIVNQAMRYKAFAW